MRRQKLREFGELRGSAVRRGDGSARGREQADGWKQKEKIEKFLEDKGKRRLGGGTAKRKTSRRRQKVSKREQGDHPLEARAREILG